MPKRLFLIIAITTHIPCGFVFSQELAALEVVGAAEPVSDFLIPRQVYDKHGRVYSHSELAIFVVESEIVELEYDSNNGIIASKSSEKADTLFLTRDERLVRIFWAKSYKLDINFADYMISFKSHQVWKLKITGFKKRERILISIGTRPDSAKIYINDSYAGYPGEYLLRQGEHSLLIKKNNYLDKRAKITVHEDSTFAFDILLEVAIKITGSPGDAIKLLDGRSISSERVSAIPGIHHLLIRKSGYRTIDTTIVVTEKNTSFGYKMSKQAAEQRIEVYSVPVFRSYSTQIGWYEIVTQYGFAFFTNYHLKEMIGFRGLYLSLFATVIKGRFEFEDLFSYYYKEDRVWLLNAGIGLNQRFRLGNYVITVKGAHLLKTNQFEIDDGLSVTSEGMFLGMEAETQLIKNLFVGLELRRVRYEYEIFYPRSGSEKIVLSGWEIAGMYKFYIQR